MDYTPRSTTDGANAVEHQVTHANGTTTVFVDQTHRSGQWNSLGTFTFAAGLAGNVTIRARGARGMVMADAIKLEYRGHSAPKVDLVASSLSGSPDPVNEGDSVSVSFTITNAGVQAADAFHLRLTRDGELMCEWNLKGLPVGVAFEGTCSGPWGIPSAQAPGDLAGIALDDRGEVPESDESNNSLGVWVPVGPS